MAAVYHLVRDGLKNLVANIGTWRDKAAASEYCLPLVTDQQLENMYRGAWLPRKIVDIPAKDALRRWRSWQADKNLITKIEAEEKRLRLQARVLEAKVKARLWGGAAIYFNTGDLNPAIELRAEKPIRHLTVLRRQQLTAGDLETDVSSPSFGQPKFYTVAQSAVQIHPSRLAIFQGNLLPSEDSPALGAAHGWSDPVLLAVLEAIRNCDSTLANVASLIFEAKIDVISIPGFSNNVADPQYREQVLERLTLAATAKGINGTLILDSEEKHESKSASFSSLPDLIDRALQVAAGAADIPATRLMSQSPAGMNATGESDTRNYYDNLQATQELEITPALAMLDQCMLAGALGRVSEKIWYQWNPLWQPTATEKATIGKTTAETIKTLADTRLFPDQALQQTAENMLIESGVAPGLDTALDEFGREVPEEETEPTEPQQQLGDAAPRTLYVSRKVTNAAEILAWAKEQGFASTQPADELHVTIAFSREKIDWMKVGQTWSGDRDGTLTIPAGGARIVEHLGDKGAVVLLFNSSELSWRHEDIKRAGASWDYESYQPHITITYQKGDLDLRQVEPYRGAIEFGPEIFEEVVEDWEKSAQDHLSRAGGA